MTPSPWVERFAALIPSGGRVLDLACGSGRHSRFLLDRGHPVVALDRDVQGVADLAAATSTASAPQVDIVEHDLETGSALPFLPNSFDGVVVTNYLHRPILGAIVDAVAPGGALLYETFARGHEAFGRPRGPEFLLEPGELLEVVRGHLRVVAYEDVVLDEPVPAAVQRVAAVRSAS